MNIFLYIRDDCASGLDEIEDAIEESLDGAGEVVGAGTGAKGSNIDIEVDGESLNAAEALRILRSALARFKLPRSSALILDGVEHPVANDC